jgi:hypothetical protein
MKVYRGKAIIIDYTEDDMLVSFYDSDEAQNVSIIIPRELIGTAKHVCSHRATTVFVGHDSHIIGMDPSDDGELVDE